MRTERMPSGRYLTAVLNHYVSGCDGWRVIGFVVWLIWLLQPIPLYRSLLQNTHTHTHPTHNLLAHLCLFMPVVKVTAEPIFLKIFKTTLTCSLFIFLWVQTSQHHKYNKLSSWSIFSCFCTEIPQKCVFNQEGTNLKIMVSRLPVPIIYTH